MGFLDKAKSAAEQAAARAEQAAARAREGVEDVQTKRNLAHAYEAMGRTAFQLVETGQISHQSLAAHAEEIRQLEAGAPAASTPPPSEAAAPAASTPPPSGAAPAFDESPPPAPSFDQSPPPPPSPTV